MRKLLCLVALLSACDNPVRPTTINGVPIPRQKAESLAWFDPTQLGHATLNGVDYRVGLREVPGTCYQRDFFLYHDEPLFIVWDARDRVNQVDVAHFPFVAQHFTLSDFQSGPIGADSVLWCIPSNPPPPVIPPPPPHIDPQCSREAFSSWEGHVEATTIIEHATVKIGYDGIVAYLMAWGVPAFRVGGDVPLPQIRTHLTTQILHVGMNVLTAPLSDSSQFAGWQWEFGCERGPDVLTERNLYDFQWIDTGWGNFQGNRLE